MKNDQVILCGVPSCMPPCCPKLKDKGDHFIIEDDYDVVAKFPKDSIQQIINDIDTILSESGDSLDN